MSDTKKDLEKAENQIKDIKNAIEWNKKNIKSKDEKNKVIGVLEKSLEELEKDKQRLMFLQKSSLDKLIDLVDDLDRIYWNYEYKFVSEIVREMNTILAEMEREENKK